jgi:hypothetical protein
MAPVDLDVLNDIVCHKELLIKVAFMNGVAQLLQQDAKYRGLFGFERRVCADIDHRNLLVKDPTNDQMNSIIWFGNFRCRYQFFER